MPHSPQDFHKKLLGKKGERAAVQYLKSQGYTIVATNYRTPFGEADIIALDNDELVFVEVKTRTNDKYGADPLQGLPSGPPCNVGIEMYIFNETPSLRNFKHNCRDKRDMQNNFGTIKH